MLFLFNSLKKERILISFGFIKHFFRFGHTHGNTALFLGVLVELLAEIIPFEPDAGNAAAGRGLNF